MVPFQHPTKSAGSRIQVASRDRCLESPCGESCAPALRIANTVADRATTSVMARLNLATRKQWRIRIVKLPLIPIRAGNFASVTARRPSDEASCPDEVSNPGPDATCRRFVTFAFCFPLFHRFDVSKGAVVSVVRQISGKFPESPDARRALTDCSIYLLAGYPRLRIAVRAERKFPTGRMENAR